MGETRSMQVWQFYGNFFAVKIIIWIGPKLGMFLFAYLQFLSILIRTQYMQSKTCTYYICVIFYRMYYFLLINVIEQRKRSSIHFFGGILLCLYAYFFGLSPINFASFLALKSILKILLQKFFILVIFICPHPLFSYQNFLLFFFFFNLDATVLFSMLQSLRLPF